MPRKQAAPMLAGQCRACNAHRQTPAPAGADGRHRLTDRQPCGINGCQGEILFRRPKGTTAAASIAEPKREAETRNVRRYRRDERPEPEPEPVGDEDQDQEPEPDPGSGDGGDRAPRLESDTTEPEPGLQLEPGDRGGRRRPGRRRYQGAAASGIYPGIVPD